MTPTSPPAPWNREASFLKREDLLRGRLPECSRVLLQAAWAESVRHLCGPRSTEIARRGIEAAILWGIDPLCELYPDSVVDELLRETRRLGEESEAARHAEQRAYGAITAAGDDAALSPRLEAARQASATNSAVAAETAAVKAAAVAAGMAGMYVRLVSAGTRSSDACGDCEIYADVFGQVCEAVQHDAGRADLDAVAAVETQAWSMYHGFLAAIEPAGWSREWHTADALAIARRVVQHWNFAAMPDLADALEAAGCNHAETLHRLRAKDSVFTFADHALCGALGLSYRPDSSGPRPVRVVALPAHVADSLHARHHCSPSCGRCVWNENWPATRD